MRRWGIAAMAAGVLVAPARAQESDTNERLDRLERENAELRRRVDVLADEQERFELGEVVGPLEGSRYGLGPAASKVYAREQGLSIGGYGEALYRALSGAVDEFDFLRAVFYFGYKFSENWVFNSEVEFEHASTEEDGAVSVEFAYLDWLWNEWVNVRAGLLLVPMGFLNELHEPPTFLSSARPETERRILPTTWRENGVGAFGDAGPLSYRAYVVTGFDAMGFSASGLRGGRQRGSKALADDFAAVVRVDWTDTPGLLAGGSVYVGDADQGAAGLGPTTTTIGELHAEWKDRGWRARALFAWAWVDDVDQLNAAGMLTGSESVGEELRGWYLELGYDIWGALFPGEAAALTPFVRYESVDTQAAVPAGFSTDPANEFEILTWGVAYEPLPGVVFKLDYADYDGGGRDRLGLSMGYAF